MDEKPGFGEIVASDIEIGDIVEWRTWNFQQDGWESHFGVVFEIKNSIIGNRLVSLSKVMPINAEAVEVELFTMNLRTISRSENHNQE